MSNFFQFIVFEMIARKDTPKLMAVITTYNPNFLEFISNFESLKLAGIDTVVVDDGSSFNEGKTEHFEKIIEKMGFQLIRSKTNSGVASALNTGILAALNSGAEFVLLLDQDSVPSESLGYALVDSNADLALEGANIAAIGPRPIDAKTGMKSDFFILEPPEKAEPKCIAPERFVKCDFLITSGCLISRQAFNAIGYMDETLFIDGVDFEWFFRAKSLGYEAYGVNDLVLNHNLGETARRIWFLRWRNIPSHAPFRYYYMFRNSILLSRRPYVPKAWIRFELKRLIKIALISCVFVSPRITNARMILKGIRDGLMGKSGKIPQ